MTLTYRTATPADAGAVARLHAASWRRTYGGMMDDAYLQNDAGGELSALWQDRLRDNVIPERHVLLAEDERGIAGFICVQADAHPSRGTLIDNLHVDATRHRSGIGRDLMRRAALWMHDVRPRDGVYLGVLEQNERARSFYETLGGTNAGPWDGEVHGSNTAPALVYVWKDPASLIAACGAASESAE
jgi:ribosomal protein S18 acetylase RimI-like enzyme